MKNTIFSLFFLVITAQSITITVSPGDSITDSLATLSQGDTLFLMPGVYVNTLEQPILAAGPNQAGVTITSPANNRAVLDGQNIERSVVSLMGPHNSSIILENLVITRGNAISSEAFNGGGISASESKVCVRNCLLIGNTAMIGGGIGAEGGSLLVEYSIIQDNEALVTGGGVDLYACDFTGFMLEFILNTSSDDGGGLNAYQSALDLSNSLFTRNYSGDDGGAITVLQGISHFSFLTIHSNEAFDDGGGMRLHTIDSVSVVSSIITSNLGKAGINVISVNMPYISNVCCWDNIYANYWGMEDPTGSNGNISADPLFADTHLSLSQIAAGQTFNSPAVDAGHCQSVDAVIAGFSTRTDSIPDTGIADMGFHHLNCVQTGVSIIPPGSSIEMVVSPSPTRGSVKISLSAKIISPVTIYVYDITGRILHSAFFVNMTDGRYWEWAPNDSFHGGLVLFQIILPEETVSGKVVVLK